MVVYHEDVHGNGNNEHEKYKWASSFESLTFVVRYSSVLLEVCMIYVHMSSLVHLKGIIMALFDIYNPPAVTENEAIVALTLEKMALRALCVELTAEVTKLRGKILTLEERLPGMIDKEYFSSMIKRMVSDGVIPIPATAFSGNIPVTCICEPEGVYFNRSDISVRVSFDRNGYTEQVRFEFVPVPAVGNLYPDFHMGYEKQKLVALKKPRTRTKKAKPAAPPSP